MNRLPGDERADVGEPVDGFHSAPGFADRLAAYAARWRLPVRERVVVVGLVQPQRRARHRADASDERGPARGEPLDAETVAVPTEARVSTVIWATGVGGDFSWLPTAVLDGEGRPIQSGGRTPLAGLHVVGLPWMSRRGSGIIHGASSDATLVAADVADALGATRASPEAAWDPGWAPPT